MALTFDDGPSPEHTPRVLDLLDEAGVKATFFVIGRKAAAHPELLRESVARGHALGIHGHVHDRLLTLRSPDTTPSAVAAQQYLERFEGFLKEQPDADRLRAILPFIHLTKDRPKMAVLMGLSEDALNLEVKNFARAVKQFVELFGTFDFFTE